MIISSFSTALYIVSYVFNLSNISFQGEIKISIINVKIGVTEFYKGK